MLLTVPVRRALTLASSTALVLLPHGGQATARRNAWSGMSADAARSRDRRQAESALAAAEHRAALRPAEGARRTVG